MTVTAGTVFQEMSLFNVVSKRHISSNAFTLSNVAFVLASPYYMRGENTLKKVFRKD